MVEGDICLSSKSDRVIVMCRSPLRSTPGASKIQTVTVLETSEVRSTIKVFGLRLTKVRHHPEAGLHQVARGGLHLAVSRLSVPQ